MKNTKKNKIFYVKNNLSMTNSEIHTSAISIESNELMLSSRCVKLPLKINDSPTIQSEMVSFAI